MAPKDRINFSINCSIACAHLTSGILPESPALVLRPSAPLGKQPAPGSYLTTLASFLPLPFLCLGSCAALIKTDVSEGTSIHCLPPAPNAACLTHLGDYSESLGNH